MNLKQAYYMKVLAQYGNFTVAAKKLMVSQPSLSQMLRQIEREAGVTLFDRSVSPFRVTYAGEKYLKAADIILDVNRQLENDLNQIKSENSGRLRLGISVTRAMQVLPLVLPEFVQRYPNVVLELTEAGSADLESLVCSGKVDLALAAIDSTSTGMTYELIEQETIGILAGVNTKLAQTCRPGMPVSLQDAEQDPFIYLSPGHSARVTQEKLFRQYGFRPNVMLETDSLEVGRRVAVAANACMILPNIYVDEYIRQKQGCFFPLINYENHRHFYACYRKEEYLPQFSRAFIQIVTRKLEEQRAINRRQ